MNGAVVKRTQDTLGKVIKKPPLTEKLLNKPPFRYLHDIFSEVIRTTGFMKGLYVEHEMKSDNVKEKDSKIAFLQKAIDVVMLVSGEPLAAKPARIVAGHEPERTNELLQAIAKCCLNKMSSEDAVKRVLESRSKASTSRSQDKENREGREPHRDRDERREILERSGSREQKAPGQEPGGQQETRERQRTRERRGKEREKDKEREPQREKDKERGDAQREKDKERGEPQREKDKERGEPQREKDRGQEKGREREKEREREKTRDRDSHRERDRDRDKRRDREKDRDRPKEGEERGNRKTRVPEEPKQRAHPEEPSKSSKAAPTPADVLENQSESPARIPRPSSAKGQRRRPNVGGQDESDSDGDGEAALTEKATPQENGEATEPTGLSNMTPSIRQTPRPSSARPAAPRVKTQERYADVSPAERLASSKALAAVIMEGKKLSEDEDDEDEQFILDEAACKAQGVEIDGDEKHGGLVKKILETKKDYESSPSSPKAKEQSVVSEGAQRKERDLVSREMERMRCSIQAVCKSTSPLGKIVQYAQEDMDAMQVELLAWRRESKEHAQALLLERRATERAVEPLKADLEELDQLIKDQQDKNCAIKSNILKNQEKIQKMVTGINFSSRT